MNFIKSMPAEKKLNAEQLKIIAIVAMIIDHIALGFLPKQTILYQVMRGIGRITMPIMCYFIAEGYYKTSNIKKYILRLVLFSILSHFPYVLFTLSSYSIPFTYYLKGFAVVPTSVIFTLLLGLIALVIYNNKKINKVLKVFMILSLCILSELSDWSYIGVLWVLAFGINHNDFGKQSLYFTILTILYIFIILLKICILGSSLSVVIFCFCIFAAIPLLSQYDGALGKKKNKWFFYIFYPLHLLILTLIKYIFI